MPLSILRMAKMIRNVRLKKKEFDKTRRIFSLQEFPSLAFLGKGGKFIMMAQIWAWLIAKTRDEEGQALVEYGLILALVAVIAIFALKFLGQNVNDTLNSVANAT